MDKTRFEQGVRREFKYLEERYGFSAPKTVDYGREIFVKFERETQEVVVSLEVGLAPIIEIFFPVAGTGDKATPWAKKDGVPRARRFPRIAIEPKYSEGEDRYIQTMAVELEKAELEWLTA